MLMDSVRSAISTLLTNIYFLTAEKAANKVLGRGMNISTSCVTHF